jgi:hypothetical protein
MNYQNKYLKYKEKYLKLKNQFGGINDLFLSSNSLLDLFSVVHPRKNERIGVILQNYFRNEPSIEYDNFKKIFKEIFNNDNDFIIKYFSEELKKKIVDLPLKIDDNHDRTIIINKKCTTSDFAGYNDMLYVDKFDYIKTDIISDELKREILLKHITKSSEYIAELITTNKPNSSIYFALAPGTLEMYYVPEFIIEQLSRDPSLTYTIIINNIDYFLSSYGIQQSNNNAINIFKSKYPELASRIYFIHLMIELPLIDNNNLFSLFLNNISNKEKINYCYYGIQRCGLLFENKVSGFDGYDHLMKLNVNYIFVGCDGLLKSRFIKKNEPNASSEITEEDLYANNLIIKQKFIDKLNSM